jgi:hypothetical protein
MARSALLWAFAALSAALACGRSPLDLGAGNAGLGQGGGAAGAAMVTGGSGGRGGSALGGRLGAAGGIAGSVGAGGLGGVGGNAGSAGVGGRGGGAGLGGRGGAAGVAGSGSGGMAGALAAGGGGGSGAAGFGGTGVGGVAGQSAGAGGSTACAPAVLRTGTATLVDVFAVDAGVIVVDAGAVALVDRAGRTLKAVPFTRPITAAAFDGATLVVADAAELTVMTAALDVGPTAFLAESCASAVLVGQKHFVCGAPEDWDRVFYTYDVGANPPVQIASTGQFTYNGVPMRRVPGADEFVTVNSAQPAQFYLFSVASSGVVSLLGGSAFNTAYDTNATFAFDGTPAAHLIQDQGDLLKLTGPGCEGTTTGGSSCFAPDGVLGALRDGQVFIGLGDDGSGTISGIVGQTGAASTGGSLCASGCTAELIAVSSRTIETAQPIAAAGVGAVVRTVPDNICATVIVGYTGVAASDAGTPNGYTIQTFAP